jgi:prevent-host-death family protein
LGAASVAWQLQEAKQRFSEVVHRAQADGPQVVTRHGREVVVVVDFTEYRHLTERRQDFRDFLLSFPSLDDEATSVFDEVAAERARQMPREVEMS